MGSSSAGLSLVGVGVTAGTTWRDSECVRRLTARELAQTLGDREAAKEVLCGAEDVYRVYAALGRPCRLKPDGSTNDQFVETPMVAEAAPPPPPMHPAAQPSPPAVERVSPPPSYTMQPIPNPVRGSGRRG